MSKELTNRQLAEAVGHALEMAEGNMKVVVSRMKSERERIEGFKVDTDSANKLFRDANLNFKQTSDRCIADLQRVLQTKSKGDTLKEWLILSLMVIATFGSLVFGGYSYYQKLQLETKNQELQGIINNVGRFFDENTKEKETFRKWNSSSFR